MVRVEGGVVRSSGRGIKTRLMLHLEAGEVWFEHSLTTDANRRLISKFDKMKQIKLRSYKGNPNSLYLTSMQL